MIRVVDDLRSAFTLSSAFAIAAATAVPLLMPMLPADARVLPLPLPAFCLILLVQMAVVYGLLGLAGCRLARSRGLEPAPFLTRLWVSMPDTKPSGPGIALAAGLVCGVLLVAAVSMIQSYLPATLPETLHPPGFTAALVASTAGSFGEEILFRLFLLSLFVRILPAGRLGTAVALVGSSLAFGAAHAPAFVFLFGGLQSVPFVSWAWLISLNGLCGVTYGLVYLRYGIESAIVAHLATDAVWHAASQLLAS